MNSQSFLATLVLVGVAAVAPWNSLVAAPPPLVFGATANTLAEQFLSNSPKLPASAADLKKFEQDNGFDGFADLVTAFEKAESVGEELVGQSVKPGSQVFKYVLAETTGVASSPTTTKAAAQTGTPSTEANGSPNPGTPQPDNNTYLLTGLQDLAGSSKVSILFLAHVYRIPPPGYEEVQNQRLGGQNLARASKWDRGIEFLQDRDQIDSIAAEVAKKPSGKSGQGAPNPTEDPLVVAAGKIASALSPAAGTDDVADPNKDSLLELVVAHGKSVTKAAADKQAAADTAAKVAAQQAKNAGAQANAAATGTPQPQTPATTTPTKTPPPIDPGTGELADTVLRNLGLSFGLGVGSTVGGQSNSVLESGLLRWNLIQEQATIRWNDKQSVGGQGGKRVGYGLAALQGRKLMEDEFGYVQNTEALEKIFWRSDYYPTSFGPFIGSAIPSNYAYFGHNPDGTPIKARPYLVGIQAGWGFYNEAGSLIYFDIGTTVSPNSGFRYSKPYFGISADGLVLLHLLEAMRSFVPGTSGSSTGK